MTREEAIHELTEWREQMENHGVPNWSSKLNALDMAISALSAEEMNIHEVACVLADLFGDTCACDYCDIDSWLPEYCDFANTCCPNTVGVACWEQYLTHKPKVEKYAFEQTDLKEQTTADSLLTDSAEADKESECALEPTCKDCKFCASCIMSAPDGQWKSCEDFEPKDRLIKFFADNLTDEDIAKGEEYARGYADGLTEQIQQTEPSEKQVTSKLKNHCDSLLTEESEDSKEQKSKLEPSDLISRADALEIISEAQDGSGSTYEILQPIFEKVNGMPSCHRCYECDEALLNRIEDSVKEEVLTRMLKKGCIEFPKDLTPSDLISRADAVKALCDECMAEHCVTECMADCMLKDALDEVPSVSAERVGEWIEPYVECSLCGKQAVYFIDGVPEGYEYYPNYCPNCGARMENK